MSTRREHYQSKRRNKINKKLVYIMKTEDQYYKIGISKNPKKRLKNIQTSNPKKVEIVTTIESNNPERLEKRLHRIFSDYNTSGEWFNVSKKEIQAYGDVDQVIFEEGNEIHIIQNTKRERILEEYIDTYVGLIDFDYVWEQASEGTKPEEVVEQYLRELNQIRDVNELRRMLPTKG